MGNCVGKSSQKDPDKKPYAKEEGAQDGEKAEGEQAAEAVTQDADAGGKSGDKESEGKSGEDQGGKTDDDKAEAAAVSAKPGEDIPLADEEAGDAAASLGVKAGDISLKMVDPGILSSEKSEERSSVTVTVQSKTITKEGKDDDAQKIVIPNIGEPMDAEKIIENIRTKTKDSEISVASQSKITTVTKTVDSTGKEIVNVATKETSYGLPNEKGETDKEIHTTTSTKTYTSDQPQVEIKKEEGGHVLVTPEEGSPSKETELFGALKMLKETSDGLDVRQTATTVVKETIQTARQTAETYAVKAVNELPSSVRPTAETYAVKAINQLPSTDEVVKKVEEFVTKKSEVIVDGEAVDGPTPTTESNVK